MPTNRDHYIGARFTKEEKDYIKKYIEKRNITLSSLVREAVFSHVTFLTEKEKEFETIEMYKKILNKDIKSIP